MMPGAGWEVEAPSEGAKVWLPVEWFECLPATDALGRTGLAIVAVYFDPHEQRLTTSQGKVRRGSVQSACAECGNVQGFLCEACAGRPAGM